MATTLTSKLQTDLMTDATDFGGESVELPAQTALLDIDQVVQSTLKRLQKGEIRPEDAEDVGL